MWWRRLAEVQTEHQNGEERGFQKLLIWDFHAHESMDPSCLVSTVQAGGGGVMVGGIFSWYTLGPLSTNWASFKHHSLPELLLLTMFHPFMTTVYPVFWGFQQYNASMSQSSNHLRLVSWTWQWVHFTQMASTVTRSQSNRAPLGCGGTGDSHHGWAADKSAATAWCYHVNMDQNIWGMFPTPCWINAMKN